ncbi:MAG: hypothetical protein ACFFD5_13925 [Candidatus Thorarchaeota archaeon]
MTLRRRKYKKEGLELTNGSSKLKNDTSLIMSDSEIKAENLNDNKNKVLQGKTLQIYWYLLTHKNAGVREIQKSLKISSPGTVTYQVNKLIKEGIISKNDEDGKYYVKESIKKGVLGFYFRLGSFMVPRYSIYLIVNILGIFVYVFLAIIYGDMFITNPGSILFLFFIIFCTCVFIFESMKIWERKPT